MKALSRSSRALHTGAAVLTTLLIGLPGFAQAPSPPGRFESDASQTSFAAEAESAPLVEEWKPEKEHPGYAGECYLAWRGRSMKRKPGSAVLRYTLEVVHAGVYQLSIRARRDQEGAARANDQANDIFVRMNGTGLWIKVSHKTRWGEWGWMRKFSEHAGLRDARFELPAGNHILEVAARSEGTKIDTLQLTKVDS